MLQSVPSTQSGFDWQMLNQLADGDSCFAVELLTIFIDDAEHSLALLKSAIAAQSCQQVEDAAHALKGASANVGANAMTQIAQQLEQSARKSDISSARSLLDLLHTHLQTISYELAAKL